jgi:hypothetical protein
MTNIAFTVAGWVLPIVLGPIVYLWARQLLNVTTWVDDLPPIFKRFAVVLLGTLVVAVLNALGIALPPECDTLPQDVTQVCVSALSGSTIVRGVTAALVAMFLHALKKERPTA